MKFKFSCSFSNSVLRYLKKISRQIFRRLYTATRGHCIRLRFHFTLQQCVVLVGFAPVAKRDTFASTYKLVNVQKCFLFITIFYIFTVVGILLFQFIYNISIVLYLGTVQWRIKKRLQYPHKHCPNLSCVSFFFPYIFSLSPVWLISDRTFFIN